MNSLADCDGAVVDTKVTYRWQIPNFCTTCPKMKKILQSPILLYPVSNLKFQMTVYPKGEGVEGQGHVSVFLSLLEKKAADVSYKIAVLNHVNKECFVVTTPYKKFEQQKQWGSYKFAGQSEIMNNRTKYLLDNKLKLLCEITVHKVYNDEGNEIIDRKRPRLDDDLISTPIDGYNFEQFFASEQLSDVTIVTTDRKCIHAHKFILASKSEIFLALFQKQTKQKKAIASNNIYIPEFDFIVVEEMLRFIYTNKVNDLSKVARELLSCAEKYALTDLKLLCETNICNSITNSNVLDLVSYAEAHKLTKLRQLTTDFIVSNMKEIVNTPDFKSTAIRHPEICVEILCRCANQD